jgi:hypothetical protein
MALATSIPLALCQHQWKQLVYSSMISNLSCPVELWPLPRRPKTTTNEWRSLQE